MWLKTNTFGEWTFAQGIDLPKPQLQDNIKNTDISLNNILTLQIPTYCINKFTVPSFVYIDILSYRLIRSLIDGILVTSQEIRKTSS